MKCKYYFATWVNDKKESCALEQGHDGEHKTSNGWCGTVAFGNWLKK